MTGRTFKILVAVPFALIPLAYITGKSINFEKMVLEPNELMVLDYSSQGLEETALLERALRPLPAKLAKFNPFISFDGALASTGSSEGAQPAQAPLNLTLTVLNPGENMAVINDNLMREGDSIRGLRVKRIEHNRVLMVDRQSASSYLEGPK